MADNSTILKIDGLVARFEEYLPYHRPAVIADQIRYVKLTKNKD
jgi:hypothetical protein